MFDREFVLYFPIYLHRIKFVKAKSEEAAHAPYSNFDYSVLEKNRTIMNPIVFDRDDQNHDSSNLFNDEEMIQNSMLPTGEERKSIDSIDMTSL